MNFRERAESSAKRIYVAMFGNIPMDATPEILALIESELKAVAEQVRAQALEEAAKRVEKAVENDWNDEMLADRIRALKERK